MVRALVVTGFGINCEEEMAAAYRLAGAEASIVHLNALFQEKDSIHRYDILNFPGGFSFGDDIGSAKVLANKFKFKKMSGGRYFIDDIRQFLADDKYILGICNGFQALVKMGLLPNTQGNFEQEVTLTHNDSGKFEDRWVRCLIAPGNPTPFFSDPDLHQIDLPVRHGEGKLLIPDEKVKAAILAKKMNVLSYADENYAPTSAYPANPNGSDLNCAGLCDPTGHILGMMPHPEAYLSLYNHPAWPRKKRRNPGLSEDGQGLSVFRNIVRTVRKTRE
ncbi:MAG: phosphoribosylformylglycinamidine synthase subunit PurQ [Candidatus Neomarinimicrobiota bacterium]|jgi:phosphoribosylformylglycinamidine synthase|nr:phosphoribosylformylglycinamidine synthase subunit PurQ [Candidatus Neomarinimicrobiota bacterium]MDD3965799.1 phosphoribosylformylglycinamidine synthase subunit PurQ [Candidatus Neomarinimicrobiota bacterium]MDX9779505.1 phosphoribosylformylglycinamidine synthase subunit PurQ [bacterium]